jgi:hypothetical protein
VFNYPGEQNYWGRVRRPAQDGYPGRSSLVKAFGDNVEAATDAIVLQGYAGRSTIVERAREFLDVAKRNQENAEAIEAVKGKLDALIGPAADILRIYLTPRLDRYVDFHKSCLIGWRFEAKAERQDAITVWLRSVDKTEPNPAPIAYRVVQETRIGPSSSAYLGGALLDDYLNQSGTQSSAWGTQSGLYGGGGKKTTPTCGD